MILKGDSVKVVRSDDEFMDRSFKGRTGRVVSTIVDDHGATPKDPAFIVEFRRGFYTQRDMFWGTELEKQ